MELEENPGNGYAPTLTLPSITNAETEGDLLRRNLLKALVMKEKHTAVNEKFNTIFPEGLRREWAEMISQWEWDRRKPDPYTHTEKGIISFIPTHTTSC